MTKVAVFDDGATASFENQPPAVIRKKNNQLKTRLATVETVKDIAVISAAPDKL